MDAVQRSRGLISACVLGLGLVGACAETEPAPEPLDARESFARELGAIICDKAEPCCAEVSLSSPTEECDYAMRTDAFIAMLHAEEERREVRLEHKDACLTHYRELNDYCSAIELASDLVTACPDLFGPIPEGTKQPGELCDGTFECASPEKGERACWRRDFNELEHCVWWVEFAAGAECSLDPSVISVCPEGFVCGEPADGSVGPAVCRTRSQLGEKCFTLDGCVAGLACSYDATLKEANCIQTLMKDEPCLDRPDACGPELYCDPSTGMCDVLPIVQACDAGNCETDYTDICQ